MPAKSKVKAAIKKGVSPYAVCGAQAKKHKMSKAKKESCVRKVTARTLRKKK